MNKKTILALEGSIKKWEGIVNFLKYKRQLTDSEKDILGTLEQGGGNCPLCHLFILDCCDGCPVKNKTGRLACGGSPYYGARGQIKELQYTPQCMKPLKVAVKKELKFLESLRED